MDFYNTILGLYSRNNSIILDVINSAKHEELFANDRQEVVHTGFYCLNHKGTRLGFLYDIKSNELYFQRANKCCFPLGAIFHSIWDNTSVGPYPNPKNCFELQHSGKYIYCYQGYNTLKLDFINKIRVPFPIDSYKYFSFIKVEGIHYVEIKNPCNIVFKQLYSGFTSF